ncbi:MAG: HNH endonuclease [Bacteriovoracaceae bacterium]|nr:HNH endonuclease [Bacteriovoracaceae bacterium]
MICKLSDKQLVAGIKIKVKEERLIITEVLNYLEEIDKRKLFVDYGTPSLFKFCTRILKYSDAEAAIRVKTIRAIKAAPIIKEKIKDGSLTLTTAASIYSFFKNNREQDRNKIVEKVCCRSTKEVKYILNSLSKNPPPRELKITLPEHLLKKLEKVGRDFDDCSELEVIECLIDKYIEQRELAKAKRTSTKQSKNQTYISREVKELVDKRAQNRCEGFSPITGKRCTSRVNLQYDHQRPISLGGDSFAENIRKLCFGCNQRAGVRAVGVEKMMQASSATLPPDVKYCLEKTDSGLQYSFILPGK